MKGGYSQTKINIYYNFLTFFLNIVNGLLIPMFFIKSYSLIEYSMILLSVSIYSFMQIITITINGTLSTLLTNDFRNKLLIDTTFNTALIFLKILFIIFSFIFTLFIFSPRTFINYGNLNVNLVRIFFTFTYLSFVLNSFSSVFSSIPYVLNRLDLFNINNLIGKIGLSIIILLLFLSNNLNLMTYACAFFLVNLIQLFYSKNTALSLMPNLLLNSKLFNSVKLKEILTFGGWLSINQIGVLLFLQIDILLINNILGPEKSGIFGVFLQWSFLLRALIGVLSSIAQPAILNYYTNNDTERILKFSVISIKFIGILSSFSASFILLFSKPIIHFWLGDDYLIYNILFILLTFHLSFNLSFTPINNLNIVYNKMKIPSIITVLTGLLSICLSIIFIKFTSLNLLGFAISGFISLTIKNYIFTPLYASYILNINYKYFYSSSKYALYIFFFTLVLKLFFTQININLYSFPYFVISVLIYTIILVAFILLICLNKKDIELFKKIFISKSV